MVEVVAGTVGDRLAATGGAVDGSETRNLESEGFAREEITSVMDGGIKPMVPPRCDQARS